MVWARLLILIIGTGLSLLIMFFSEKSRCSVCRRHMTRKERREYSGKCKECYEYELESIKQESIEQETSPLDFSLINREYRKRMREIEEQKEKKLEENKEVYNNLMSDIRNNM